MKSVRKIALLASVGAMLLGAAACSGGDDDPVGMDPTLVKPELLIGTWKNDGDGNNLKKYTTVKVTATVPLPDDGDYKDGSDWTIGETTEDQEGTEFYYKLVGNRLTEQYPNVGQYLPREYTLMTLTATKLEYFDSYSERYSWTKQ